MKKVILFENFRFGYNYDKLYRGKAGRPNAEAVASIEEFIDWIKEFNLEVTAGVLSSSNLMEFLEKIRKLNGSDIISTADSDELANIIISADKTIDSELKLRHAYSLTEKKIGLDKLLNKVDSLFDNDIFNKLPAYVQTDFSEAGQCIAFDRDTAAAFHVLRGTEGMLRLLYMNKIKKNRLTVMLWNPMLEQLSSRKDVPKPLLSVLDHIRTNFRNPTMHPETIYGSDEVQNLFHLCVDAITRIVKEIADTSKP